MVHLSTRLCFQATINFLEGEMWNPYPHFPELWPFRLLKVAALLPADPQETPQKHTLEFRGFWEISSSLSSKGSSGLKQSYNNLVLVERSKTIICVSEAVRPLCRQQQCSLLLFMLLMVRKSQQLSRVKKKLSKNVASFLQWCCQTYLILKTPFGLSLSWLKKFCALIILYSSCFPLGGS